MQLSREPMALCTIAAVTHESTPPLMPQTTLWFPTFSLISFTELSINAPIVQEGLHLETLKMKFPSIFAPSGVCTTSGWNCTPKNLLEESFIAAIEEFSLLAI